MEGTLETYLNYDLKELDSTTVLFTEPNNERNRVLRLGRLTRFRVISENNGWRVEATENRNEYAKPFTLRTTGHEIGSCTFFNVWLASPNWRPLDLGGRPTTRTVFAPTTADEDIRFKEVEGRRTREFSLRDAIEPTLHGTAVGQVWKWWIQLTDTGGAGSFYVDKPFARYREIHERWLALHR